MYVLDTPLSQDSAMIDAIAIHISPILGLCQRLLAHYRKLSLLWNCEGDKWNHTPGKMNGWMYGWIDTRTLAKREEI